MADASDLASIIQQAALRHGLNPSQFMAQMRQESGLDPNIVSKAGAVGIGQLMPATARSLGVTNPRDPAQNVEGAATFMQRLTQQFGGDHAKALAAYNWGPGNLAKAGGDFSHAPAETQAYVAKLSNVAPSSPAIPTPPVPPAAPASDPQAPPAPDPQAAPPAPAPTQAPASVQQPDQSPLASLLAQSAAAVRGQGVAQAKPGQPAANSLADSLRGLA